VTGYLLTGGAGLLGVLGCTIWALVERSRRKSADIVAVKETAKAIRAEGIAKQNAAVVGDLKAELKSARFESREMENRLKELRKRLAECADPQTIKDWLDELGQGGSL
jgi:hypothetical protein